ncbi:uncharacterized protein ANIA_11265 [Aspergillus nidulans FGSC A4]|uniref:Uncharacterized protein n=1 Tax=Emericella nidulans (strain FGSC A4 / ATCC 38163 / CBS 112.46 / NRRL 194 / M139) TaxID=227321 RepID=C8VUM7_EMENI|nr:hypothetical protein [Aspergillus nidulans FGSC A4]CBF89923.1 TPA: hypothetical protein ANIA_11265 [Aspergillus nidulans FGSC A4]
MRKSVKRVSVQSTFLVDLAPFRRAALKFLAMPHANGEWLCQRYKSKNVKLLPSE